MLSVEQEDLLAAVSGAAQGCELFTEDDRLGAVSGAARGCEPFTEDYLLGAVSGAAGSCGRKDGFDWGAQPFERSIVSVTK